MRRTLIIVAIIIVILGIGGFVYWKYFTGDAGLAVGSPSLPDASSSPFGAGQSDVSISESAAALSVTQVTSRLTRISAGPVVPGVAVIAVGGGAVATSSTSSSTPAAAGPDTAVLFIERRSGNIFSYLLGARTLSRISNKTLPGIQTAQWSADGKIAFVTYLSGDDLATVNTYALPQDGSNGFFLPTGLSGIAVSSTSLMTLVSGASGSVASRSKLDGSGGSTAWSSPLSALRIAFAGTKGYVAFTKPTQSLAGSLFAISTGGVFTRIAGPLPGLVALPSHSGNYMLISSANGGVMQTSLLNTATGASSALPLATIADKCAWSRNDLLVYCGVPQAPAAEASYPDDWYQGVVPFTDRIWKVDVSGRFVQMAFDPATASAMGSLDVLAPVLDAAGTTLIFANKNDGSLWAYRL